MDSIKRETSTFFIPRIWKMKKFREILQKVIKTEIIISLWNVKYENGCSVWNIKFDKTWFLLPLELAKIDIFVLWKCQKWKSLQFSVPEFHQNVTFLHLKLAKIETFAL